MKRYHVKKIDLETEKVIDFGGGYTEEDIRNITRGYTFNGLFYGRKNCKYIYIVEKEN